MLAHTNLNDSRAKRSPACLQLTVEMAEPKPSKALAEEAGDFRTLLPTAGTRLSLWNDKEEL